jgi:phage terminase small subunit
MPRKKSVLNPGEGKTLDDRQERFCREYLTDFNATRAAKAAGYSEKTAGHQASDLLKRPDIQSRIQAISKEIYEAVGDPVKRIILDLQMQAFGDLKDFMEWDDQEIKWKSSKELGEKTKMVQEVSETTSAKSYNRKFKLYDRQKAQELLMRYYGLFKDTVRHEGEVKTVVHIKVIPNGRELK